MTPSSRKGSHSAANMAVGLAKLGYKVGLVDADIAMGKCVSLIKVRLLKVDNPLFVTVLI